MASRSNGAGSVQGPAADQDQYRRLITFAMHDSLRFIGARPDDPLARRGSIFESITVISDHTGDSGDGGKPAPGSVKAAKVHVEVIESRTGTGLAVSIVKSGEPRENRLTVLVGNEIFRLPRQVRAPAAPPSVDDGDQESSAISDDVSARGSNTRTGRTDLRKTHRHEALLTHLPDRVARALLA